VGHTFRLLTAVMDQQCFSEPVWGLLGRYCVLWRGLQGIRVFLAAELTAPWALLEG
jgi:hypothetical protein